MDLYDVVTLDDNKNYSLIKTKEYEGETYCLFLEVDSLENPTENLLILKKIQLDNGEFEFEELDEETLETISELFKDQFLNEMEKN